MQLKTYDLSLTRCIYFNYSHEASGRSVQTRAQTKKPDRQSMCVVHVQNFLLEKMGLFCFGLADNDSIC